MCIHRHHIVNAVYVLAEPVQNATQRGHVKEGNGAAKDVDQKLCVKYFRCTASPQCSNQDNSEDENACKKSIVS